MSGKPTYEELAQRIRKLEKESAKRKQAEKELRASEEKYRSILENIEEGYWEVDLPGNFTFFNDSICKFFGYWWSANHYFDVIPETTFFDCINC